MATEVRKINHLKNIESFIQVNLFKGYVFADNAGSLVNSFFQNNQPPQFTLGLEGLIISKPDNVTEEMKISSELLWTRYINPASLDQIANAHIKKLDLVSRILNVDSITRVGWRNYFVYEYRSEKERNRAFDKFSVGQRLSTELSAFKMALDKIYFSIIIRKINKNNPSKTPAILIDVDAFETYKEPESVTNTRKIINEIRQTIQSKEFLEEINQIIK
jgi:hypothetical protein